VGFSSCQATFSVDNPAFFTGPEYWEANKVQSALLANLDLKKHKDLTTGSTGDILKKTFEMHKNQIIRAPMELTLKGTSKNPSKNALNF
jgi:hypothetical protein